MFIVFSAPLFAGARTLWSENFLTIETQDCKLSLYVGAKPDIDLAKFQYNPCLTRNQKPHKSDLPEKWKEFKITGELDSIDGDPRIQCKRSKTGSSPELFAVFIGKLPNAPAWKEQGRNNQICRLIVHKSEEVDSWLKIDASITRKHNSTELQRCLRTFGADVSLTPRTIEELLSKPIKEWKEYLQGKLEKVTTRHSGTFVSCIDKYIEKHMPTISEDDEGAGDD